MSDATDRIREKLATGAGEGADVSGRTQRQRPTFRRSNGGPWFRRTLALNALRYRGRAWCKAFDLEELLAATLPTSRVGVSLRAAITEHDLPSIAHVAVTTGLVGEMKEDSTFGTLAAGTWRPCAKDVALTWARALQARSGCTASARVLARLAAEPGDWLQIDDAVAVVNARRILLFFDAG